MKRILILVMIMFACHVVIAQSDDKTNKVSAIEIESFNPVRNFQVTNPELCVAALTWEVPEEESGWIQYCASDEIARKYCWSCNIDKTPAMRFTPNDLEDLGIVSGHNITKIAIGVGKGISQIYSMHIKIWEGGTSLTDPGTLKYQQNITSNVLFFTENAMNEVTLTTPFEIDATKELRIGYRVVITQCALGICPFGSDAGPSNGPEKSFILYDAQTGNWTDASKTFGNYNWSLKAFVPNDKTPTFYDIYCDDIKVGNTVNTNYSHTVIEEDNYSYCVVAVYEKGQSEKVCDDIAIDCILPYCPAITNLVSIPYNNNILIKWTVAEGNPTEYKVYNGTDEVATVTNTEYLFENLAEGEHILGVEAWYDDDCEPIRITVSIVVANAVINPKAIIGGVNCTEATLSWAAPKGDNLTYRVQHKNGSILVNNYPDTVYSYNDVFEHGKTYIWEITTLTNSTGESAVVEVSATNECTDIDEVNVIEKVKFYPNPTDEKLQVMSYESRIENIDVFDVFGQKIMTDTFLRHAITINISHLPVGVYFVRITTEKGIITKKIVKL